jgi:hypothetical protein
MINFNSNSFFFLMFYSNIRISDSTKVLIRNILEINPIKRFTATQVLDSIMSILATHLWFVYFFLFEKFN